MSIKLKKKKKQRREIEEKRGGETLRKKERLLQFALRESIAFRDKNRFALRKSI
jgi:hypothetical protein